MRLFFISNVVGSLKLENPDKTGGRIAQLYSVCSEDVQGGELNLFEREVSVRQIFGLFSHCLTRIRTRIEDM